MVPVLLHHDLEEHVLIISDLGSLPDLSECFGNLCTISLIHKSSDNPPASPAPRNRLIAPAEGSVIGEKVGMFFAGLHQPENVDMIRAPPYNDAHFLSHDGMLDTILNSAIKPVKEQLGLFPHLFSEHQISSGYQRIEDNFTRKTENDEKVIALGDCWTGALLVALENEPDAAQVGIIDWEFASIGRGVNGDVAQLLAHLHLLQIAAVWRRETGSQVAIDTILQSLTAAYRRRSQALGAPWLAQSASLAPDPYSLTTRVMRSAFLAHGAEMVNNAFWKEWACDSELCGGHESRGKEHCKLVERMVDKGWWYLSHAKDDEVQFVDTQNWDAIRHDESIILPLFYEG
jgi:hypothetical protein